MIADISIIIPVYKVEKYIRECIESTINQTFQPKEVILVDDGSPDQSGIICDEYANMYSFIKVIHKENGGLSEARNIAIKESESTYFMLLDSDDTIEPDACEKIYSFITQTPVDILVCKIVSIYPELVVIKNHCNDKNPERMTGCEYLKSEIINKKMYYEAPQAIYKKSFIVEKGLLFEKGLLHEDQLFTIKAHLRAQSIRCCDYVYYNHKIRENSITTQKDQIPNAKSIVKICSLLEKEVENCADILLKQLIMDHAVDLYYKAYIDANLIVNENIRVEKNFLRKYSKSKKNKIRTLIYCFNERFFFAIEHYRRNAKDKMF